MHTEAHLFSVPNDCLWYDKLWGPSQRVVTLLLFFTASLNVGGSGSNALNLLSKCELNVTHLTIFSCPDKTLKKDTNLSASIGILDQEA